MKQSWAQKAAKRIVAEAALRHALEEIEKARVTGGPRTYSGSGDYRIAKHLAQHAAEQLRLSEES